MLTSARMMMSSLC